MNDKLKELKHRNLKLITGFLCLSILAIIGLGNIRSYNKKKQQHEIQESITASREAYLEAESKVRAEAAAQSINNLLIDDAANTSYETSDSSYTNVLAETDNVMDETTVTSDTYETIGTTYDTESSASNESKSSIRTGASARIDPEEFSAASSGGTGISVKGEPIYSSNKDKTKASSYSSSSSSSSGSYSSYSSKAKTTSKSKKKSKSSSKREDYLEDLAEEYMEAEGLDYDSAYEASEED